MRSQNKSFYADAIQRWTEINTPVGVKLGYPACCIKEFCEQPPELLERISPTTQDRLRFQAAHVNGSFSGFIPCLKHAHDIIYGNTKLQDIITNRAIDIPNFPFA